MEKRDTRNEIIKAGMELIVTQGYGATGIGTLLRRAQVPKGSFYHYFPSKEAFGLAVIDRFAEGYEDLLRRFLQDPTCSPLQRLDNYLAEVATGLEQRGCQGGCLIGVLGQELAAQNETFRLRLEEIFARWQDAFADVFEAARDVGEIAADEDPLLLAGVLLSGLQGALLRSKLQRSARPLRELSAFLMARMRV